MEAHGDHVPRLGREVEEAAGVGGALYAVEAEDLGHLVVVAGLEEEDEDLLPLVDQVVGGHVEGREGLLLHPRPGMTRTRSSSRGTGGGGRRRAGSAPRAAGIPRRRAYSRESWSLRITGTPWRACTRLSPQGERGPRDWLKTTTRLRKRRARRSTER